MNQLDVCAACGGALAMPLRCEACGHTRSPREIESLDFFALFGLPQTYQISRGALEKSYLRLSRVFHPDRHQGETTLGPARRLAAHVNEAYAVLKEPLRRAAYFIKLMGGEGEGARKMAPAFLQEQLALREAAEAAGKTERDQLRAQTAERITERQRALERQLAEPAPEGLQTARRLLDEIQFFRTFLRDLDQGAPR